jgi:hypothetical protein
LDRDRLEQELLGVLFLVLVVMVFGGGYNSYHWTEGGKTGTWRYPFIPTVCFFSFTRSPILYKQI